MDYLQYFRVIHLKMEFLVVLNLIINGLPSILCSLELDEASFHMSF